MLAESFRFEGFDAPSFLNLLSLFSARGAAELRAGDLAAPERRGTLIAVLSEDGRPCASFVTGRGPVTLEPVDPRPQLPELCAQLGVARALVLEDGAIEELTEGAAEAVLGEPDYAGQWLLLLGVARALEDKGMIRVHPPHGRLPLPSPAILQRALDVLLPDEHVMLFALWDGPKLWTACALLRRDGLIASVTGPERLLAWTGPLGGDYRRDQRALQRAVSSALGPVHIGLFAQRERVEQLLVDGSPGAWARAIALRDVIIDPAPAYVHLAVGADAARGASHRASQWLGGLDLFGYLAPAGQFVREHVARVGSITTILGFNPLQALAHRLRRTPRSEEPPPEP